MRCCTRHQVRSRPHGPRSQVALPKSRVLVAACRNGAHWSSSSSAAGQRWLGARAQQAQQADTASVEDAELAEPCYPAFVFMDNKSTRSYTEFTVEVKDYPGLLRVVSWVLNGLGVRVINAVMKTLDDGTAQDVFWVTDLQGRKLSDRRAEDVADRLQDFVTYCAPPSEDSEFKEYRCGNIFISNVVDEKFTIATITADLYSPGLLFELASVINGQGISVAQAIIRGGEENPITQDHLQRLGKLPQPPSGKRVIQMWLKETHTGNKLEYTDVSALIYTLRLVMGNGNNSTMPPNADINVIACPCDEEDGVEVAVGTTSSS